MIQKDLLKQGDTVQIQVFSSPGIQNLSKSMPKAYYDNISFPKFLLIFGQCVMHCRHGLLNQKETT